MRKILIPAVALVGALSVGLPAFAQETTPTTPTAPAAPPAAPEAPATPAPTTPAPTDAATSTPTSTPTVVISAPEGYVFTETGAVTADQLKGVKIYDPAGNDVGEIADVALGADNALSGVISDIGGFLGMGEHRVSLTPDQIQVYKNSDNDMRAYVTMTKDALKAMPAYVAPN